MLASIARVIKWACYNKQMKANGKNLITIENLDKPYTVDPSHE